MADREIKRNGRGQIISYEILGALDSNIDSDSYGKSLFENNVGIRRANTTVSKYNLESLESNVDITLSDELLSEDKAANPAIDLGYVATIDIPRGPSGTSGE